MPPPRRAPTFTERMRREQLVAVTIDVIARHGYAGCSLQRIADAAGITKAAVVYHFASKNAVIRAAYDAVIAALTAHVTERLTAAPTAGARVEAYVESVVEHMARHPGHVRVIVEALGDGNDTGIDDSPRSARRWVTLAQLVDAAVESGDYRADIDSRVLAIVLNGAIDAVVAESLEDPTFDLDRAAAAIVELLTSATRA